jgi:hypothetical protein
MAQCGARSPHQLSEISPDFTEVIHELQGITHCFGLLVLAEKEKVGPERAAKKSHTVDRDATVLQKVDATVGGLAPQLGQQPRPMVPAELMISSDVDDGFACKGLYAVN